MFEKLRPPLDFRSSQNWNWDFSEKKVYTELFAAPPRLVKGSALQTPYTSINHLFSNIGSKDD